MKLEDIIALTKTDGENRDVLERRIHNLAELAERLTRDNNMLNENVGHVQKRCTELIEQVRFCKRLIQNISASDPDARAGVLAGAVVAIKNMT